MKYLLYIGVALYLACINERLHAQEAEWIVGLELGTNEIDIDSDVAVFDDEFDYTGYSFGYILGYRWSNQVVVEANLHYASNDSLFRSFDHFEMVESKLMLGYSLSIKENLRLVPMLGLSRWEIDAKEGQLLNPGPEDERSFDGTDLTFKLRLDIPVGDLVVLSASYANSFLDIGSSDMAQIALKFEF